MKCAGFMTLKAERVGRPLPDDEVVESQLKACGPSRTGQPAKAVPADQQQAFGVRLEAELASDEDASRAEASQSGEAGCLVKASPEVLVQHQGLAHRQDVDRRKNKGDRG